jgi:hypothetical protein
MAAVLVVLVAGCTNPVDRGPANGWPAAEGVVVLAKADGWRDGLRPEGTPHEYFAVLEIAYDATTAQAAWEDSVPGDLPERDGEPREPGRYGSLDAVDFAEQVLVVYSSGESGSCPGWLADVSTTNGTVQLTSGAYVPDEACTDDYNAYRLVLAVDRDRLPVAAELPTEQARFDGGGVDVLVAAYPVR